MVNADKCYVFAKNYFEPINMILSVILSKNLQSFSNKKLKLNGEKTLLEIVVKYKKKDVWNQTIL